MKTAKLFVRFLACLSLTLLALATATAQQQSNTTGPVYISVQNRPPNSNLLSPRATRLGMDCATPPSPSAYRKFGSFQQMSLKAAASLNALFGPGSISGSWSAQSQVMVWRQGYAATCPSTNGSYLVVYGAEWDGAMAIRQDSLSGKAGFAIVAASAEITNSSTAYDYVAVGYQNNQALADWAAANGKLLQDMAANGLNVNSYATIVGVDFGVTLNVAQQLAPVSPPDVIGYIPVGTTSLSEALARGHAIMFIANDKNCNDAENAFPVKEPWVGKTIREVYLQLSVGKSDCKPNADPDEEAIASRLLSGIDISRP